MDQHDKAHSDAHASHFKPWVYWRSLIAPLLFRKYPGKVNHNRSDLGVFPPPGLPDCSNCNLLFADRRKRMEGIDS